MSGIRTLTVDAEKKIRLPDAKPGEVFSYEISADGIKLKLVPQPAQPRVVVGKLVKRGNALILEAPGIQVDADAIAEAVREERDSR